MMDVDAPCTMPGERTNNQDDRILRATRYALLLDTYIKDREERDHLFNAYNNIPCVKQKGE